MFEGLEGGDAFVGVPDEELLGEIGGLDDIGTFVVLGEHFGQVDGCEELDPIDHLDGAGSEGVEEVLLVLIAGGAKNRHDFERLQSLGFPGKYWLECEQLQEDAAGRPDVDLGGIVSSAKQQLRSSIVLVHDVRDVLYAGAVEDLGTSEVADLYVELLVQQNVIGLEISVTDVLFMDKRESFEQLFEDRLDCGRRYMLVLLLQTHDVSLETIGNVLKHKVLCKLVVVTHCVEDVVELYTPLVTLHERQDLILSTNFALSFSDPLHRHPSVVLQVISLEYVSYPYISSSHLPKVPEPNMLTGINVGGTSPLIFPLQSLYLYSSSLV
jgi:hypothetical protein